MLLGALGDVLGGVFGRVVSFHDDGDEKTDPAEAAAAGRERLMNLCEEVHAALPAVAAPGEPLRVDSKDDADARDPPSLAERGRSTREPVADRTALGAEVDSVLVAARRGSPPGGGGAAGGAAAAARRRRRRRGTSSPSPPTTPRARAWRGTRSRATAA